MKGSLLLAVLALLPLTGCHRVPEASSPLPHDVYVWQRVWTPEVADGLTKASESMQTIVVFAGQISPGGDAPAVARPEIDYERLNQTRQPVGLALRVDPYSGPFRSDDDAIRSIVELARERLAVARRHGIEPAELHFDFDCAESKLDGYRTWLRAVREAVKPLPVYPTVLPSWLKHSSFTQLAKECGQFILQVHCVKPPRTIADTRTLTDPDRAIEWVDQAAKIGVPFRVALPTYAYLVAFDADEKPKGISAEGPSARWQAGSKVFRWEADPSALAGLVARWSQKRPASMKGVIWYRLPVQSDSLNWRWTTLAAVMQGRSPSSDLRLEATPNQPSDILLINHGERNELLPEQIIAIWDDAPLVSADALAGYDIESRSPSRVVFRRRPEEALSRLSPGSQRPIGWIRCEKPARIQVVATPPADDAGQRDSPPSPDDAGHRHGVSSALD
jgi:hypothetical protein